MDGATLVIADSIWSGYFGRVYIYDLRENGWECSQVIDGDGLLLDDKPFFGERLAISSDVLAIGAHGVDQPTTNAGELRIYERGTDGWEMARRFRLPAIHEVIRREYFGYGSGISIHGDTVVSSAPAGFEGGVVFVHERIAGVWRRTAKIDSPSTDVGAGFGVATAIWGDTLVVGRPHESFHAAIGRAYVYERNSLGDWTLMQSLRASDAFVDGDSGDRFGGSLALMEDRLVVGANNAWTLGYHTGTAYLFERNLDGTWSQTENRRLVASDTSGASDFLGISVDIHRSFIVAGAPAAWSDGVREGKAYVFTVELGQERCVPGAASARLVLTGSEEATDQQLFATIDGGPPGALGLLTMSASLQAPPFVPGPLCLGAPVRRLAILPVGPEGVALHELDFSSEVLAGALTAGSTHHFQFAYETVPGTRQFDGVSNAVTMTLQ